MHRRNSNTNNYRQSPQQGPQQGPQTRRNIIFYSELCDSCTNLRKMMHNENILQYFEPQCIDNKEDYYKRIGITHVPTLIVADVPKPLVSVDAFKWLQDIKRIRYQNMIDNNKKIIQQNMMKNMQMEGPNAFMIGEMTGLSDKFAYTDTDMAQPKSFSYGNEDAIYTAPVEEDKISKADQAKLIKDAEQARLLQAQEFETKMKKGQLDAIIRSEQNKLHHNN